MGSSRIKQNRGRYCVDRERTEHDVWGILRFFPGHMVQVTLLVVVVGIEIVALGGWIIPTIVWLVEKKGTMLNNAQSRGTRHPSQTMVETIQPPSATISTPTTTTVKVT